MEIDANMVALAGLLIGGVELRMAIAGLRRELKANERRIAAVETFHKDLVRRLNASGIGD